MISYLREIAGFPPSTNSAAWIRSFGPEMRSTGEVMGISKNFGQAFAKAQLAAGQRLPRKGAIFLSVSDHDKRHFAPLAKELHALGFRLIATRGTAAALEAAGVPAEPVYKVNEGRPNIVDLVKTGKVDMVINTPLGRESFYDEKVHPARRDSLQHSMHYDAIRCQCGGSGNPRARRAFHRSFAASSVACEESGGAKTSVLGGLIPGR